MTATGMTVMIAVIVIGTLRLVVTALVRLTAVTMTGTMISVMMTGGLVLRHLGGRWMIDGRMMRGVRGVTSVGIPTSVEMEMEAGTVVEGGRLLQS